VYFLGVLRQKWVENSFLDEKNTNPIFLATTMAGIHGILTLHRLFLFERNRGE
jgi:hypothetical protein